MMGSVRTAALPLLAVALLILGLVGGLLAVLTYPAQAQDDAEPLTAAFLEDTGPASHEGAGKTLGIRILFSRDIDTSYKVQRYHALEVDGGKASEFRRVGGSNSLWETTVAPDSDAAVTLTLPETTDCDAEDAVCTADGEPLSQSVTITIPGPTTMGVNGSRWSATTTVGAKDSYLGYGRLHDDDAGNAETLTSYPTEAVAARPDRPVGGLPTITGTARAGETLTPDADSIEDHDGLNNVSYSYPWITNDGSADADAPDATSTTCEIADGDVGKTIEAWVDFTDDAGHAETLTSEATATVTVATPPRAPGELQVKTGGSQDLAVSWEATQGGASATGYKVQWKSGTEEFDGSADSTRQAVLNDTATLTYTVTGLTNGTEYTVRVIASNAFGDGPPSSEVSGTPEAPNVIVIFLDDLGYADVGFGASLLDLNSRISTPNLDRLSNEGITFSNGYVTSPVCSPSRSGLLTGRYPARFGMEANLAFNPFDGSLGLTTDETLLSTYLQNAGYYTGMVGKWHLGAAKKFTPRQRGFDYFFGFLGGSHDYYEVDASDPGNKKKQPLMENTTPLGLDEYLTDALTDKAIDFVKEERDKPFFLYLPYNAPHSPYQAPTALESQVPSDITDSKTRTYLAMVLSVDQNVGRLLTALEAAAKRDNTIVFLLSDHGGIAHGPMDNGVLRGGKGTLYEGGLRVPFVASWPARWPQNRTYDPMVISLDITATIIDLANATVTDTTRPIDGVSLDPYVRGEETGAPHQALFWRTAESGSTKIQAVRSGNMKLVQRGSQTPQLYNLATDIGEQNDLYADQEDTARTLAALWNTWNQGNTKASHIWGISSYEEAFAAWRSEHLEARLDWVADQTRHQITIE